MRTIRISILLCLLSLSVFASNEDETFIRGQVIHADGSRVSTLLRVPDNATTKAIIFRDAETGTDTEVSSDNIRSITVVLNGETVEYMHTQYIDSDGNRSKDAVWIKTISWGDVIAYRAELQNGGHIFLLKRDGESIPREIDQRGFRHTIVSYISDHTYLTQDVEKGVYQYNRLKELMDEYNSWKSFE